MSAKIHWMLTLYVEEVDPSVEEFERKVAEMEKENGYPIDWEEFVKESDDNTNWNITILTYAYMHALEMEKPNFDLVKFLVKKGFNLCKHENFDAYGIESGNIFDWIAEMVNYKDIVIRAELILFFVWYFEEGGGNINFDDGWGHTNYYHFARLGMGEMIDYLMEKGAETPKNPLDLYDMIIQGGMIDIFAKMLHRGFPMYRLFDEDSNETNLIELLLCEYYDTPILDEHVEVIILQGFDISVLPKLYLQNPSVQKGIAKLEYQKRIGISLIEELNCDVPMPIISIMGEYLEEAHTNYVAESIKTKRKMTLFCENCKKEDCCCGQIVKKARLS
jgi:hypothetical protein